MEAGLLTIDFNTAHELSIIGKILKIKEKRELDSLNDTLELFEFQQWNK